MSPNELRVKEALLLGSKSLTPKTLIMASKFFDGFPEDLSKPDIIIFLGSIDLIVLAKISESIFELSGETTTACEDDSTERAYESNGEPIIPTTATDSPLDSIL